MNDVPGRIRRFNAGRDPERLKLKYKGMRRSRSGFLRGTCHLFYERWTRSSPLDDAPLAWLCGDLHFENFGAYKGDNRAVYFDINDFDEALLAPCTWDVARFLTSILVTARDDDVRPMESRDLCELFLSSYVAALRDGKARWIERETAGKGVVGDLLRALRKRKRGKFLRKRVRGSGRNRRFVMDPAHLLPATRAECAAVEGCLAGFARTQPRPAFFEVIDVARRIAGLGSLGVRRWAILVEGWGSPDRNYLLDLKEALPSALQAYVPVPQPRWKSPAHRVVTLQKRIQAIPAALLHPLTIGTTSFILRELQPAEDRVTVGDWRDRAPVTEAVTSMAELTAWAHLRTSGRQGAAVGDVFVDFARAKGWTKRLLDSAPLFANQVDRDWRAFRDALGRGFFKDQTQRRRTAGVRKRVA